MRKLIALLALVLGLCSASVAEAQSNATCHGHFPNPVSDVCWGCFFPLSLGGAKLWKGDRPDTENPASPVCFCGSPVPRVGLAFGFWEPVRLVDVTTKPFCFPNLGGINLNPGFFVGNGQNTQGRLHGGTGAHTSQFQAHYYVYPVFYLLELLADFLCFEQASFDIAYVTEIDPTWQDDAISALIFPEGAVFAFPLAQAACAADCVAATAKLPLDALFWCAGCNGAMYPMSGNVGNTGTMDQAMRLSAERMVYKMHRTGLAWGTMGKEALCKKYFMPILKKRQYRLQMVNPSAMVTGKGSCAAIGTSSALPKSSRMYPVIGEDVGYLLWRKRNCCVL